MLDAPCGFGRHSLVLAERGIRVTGLDVSDVQLREARRAAGDAEWLRLLIVEPDGSRVERRVDVRIYTVTELDRLLAGAGFEERAFFGGFDGETPVSPQTRLVVRAR